MKRIMLWSAVIMIILGCGDTKNIALESDLRQCLEFAKGEVADRVKHDKVVDRCMESQDHLGFMIAQYRSEHPEFNQ